MLKGYSYILSNGENEIREGSLYYFGELWDGDGDGEELLESGAICIRDNETEDFKTVHFETVEKGSDIMSTTVKVTSIF